MYLKRNCILHIYRKVPFDDKFDIFDQKNAKILGPLSAFEYFSVVNSRLTKLTSVTRLTKGGYCIPFELEK